MSDFILRPLRLEDEAAFFAAITSWEVHPGFDLRRGYVDDMPFPELVDLLEANARGERVPEGFVPSTNLFGFVGDELVSRISIRHELNDFLFRLGGHIGYGVMPGHRRRGYGREMLRRALPVARGLGLQRVLLTCDDENIGSIRTIEGCGGVLENVVEGKRRYWIELLTAPSE